MPKPLLALALSLCATPALACSPALFERLDAPLSAPPDESIDVAEIRSVEGGEWQAWRGGDGAAHEVARIDYGEMGRLVSRLVVEAPGAYAVTVTQFIYSVPIYIAGSTTIREEKDIYLFCDGQLLQPGEDFALDPAYAERAAEALALFDAPEIAGHLPELAR